MAVGEVRLQHGHGPATRDPDDPSYLRQIVTLTYPHIATPAQRRGSEAARVYAEGLVVRDLPRLLSHWAREQVS